MARIDQLIDELLAESVDVESAAPREVAQALADLRRALEIGTAKRHLVREPHGLRTALTWWIPGMTIACGYFFYTYRSMLETHTPATSVDR